MKRNITTSKSMIAVSILSLSSVLALTGCNPDSNTTNSGSGSAQSGTLTGIGASSQKSAVDAWTSDFQTKNSGSTIQYSADGSGAGRTAFINNAAQFAGSDAAMKTDELEKAKARCGAKGAFDIPVYISPIVVAFNLDNVKELNLDSATISNIFSGKITNWNDAAIAALNPGVTLPDLKITPVHRGDESGTTQNFTDYLNKTAKDQWPDAASQSWPQAYGGEAAQKTAGVISTTEGTKGAITYADESGVSEKLGKAKIKVGDQFVAVSPDAAAKVVESSPKTAGRAENDLAIDINRNSSDPSTYPLVLVSYHVVCSAYPDQKTADLVKAWENYVVSEDGQNTAKTAAGSAPLSSTLRDQAKKAIDSITTTQK